MTDKLREACRNAADVLEEAASYTSSESWSPSMTEEVQRAERMCRAALAASPTSEPAQGAEPVAEDDSSLPCPRCDGSGSITVPSDNGPDAYDVDECCPHCEGHGTLDAAYRGLLKLHDIKAARLLEVSGKLWGLKHHRETRDAFLLEVGEDLARWVDPIGYWKDRAARTSAPAQVTEEQRETLKARALAVERAAVRYGSADDENEDAEMQELSRLRNRLFDTIDSLGAQEKRNG